MSRKRGAKTMGTRSLTIVLDDDGHEICVLYRQFDGYPTGHGADLKEFLQGFRIVNGLGPDKSIKLANGMGCLAGQIISHFKQEIGGFYLYPSGTRDCGEEYIYTIYQKKDHLILPDTLFLKIQAGAVTYFGFPGTKQANMPVIFDDLLEAFDPPTVEDFWRNRTEDPPNDFLDDQILSADTLEVSEDSKTTQ